MYYTGCNLLSQLFLKGVLGSDSAVVLTHPKGHCTVSINIVLRYGEKQKVVKVSWDKKGGNDLSNINRSELDGKTIL